MLKISRRSFVNTITRPVAVIIALVMLVTGVTGLFTYKRHSELAAASAACQRVQRPLSSDIAAGINRNKADYVSVSNATGVPWELLASIHYRETGFSRSNPDNGYGIFQFTPPPRSYPKGPVSDAEFRSQLTYMANRIQNDYVNRSGLNYKKRKLVKNEAEAFRIKDVLFSYNGRAAVYAKQAQDLGYSRTSAPYEGSPYVMNMFDCQRASMGIITQDYGGLDGKDTRYGAFTLYARLKGDSYWKSLQNDKVDRAKFERLVGQTPSVIQNNGSSLANYTKTVSLGDKLYVFHYDSTNRSLLVTQWNGKRWTTRTLDGVGGIANRSVNNDVGKGIDAFVYHGELQVFYYDDTDKSLRHAWSSNNGERWKSETMEGTQGSLSGYNGSVGRYIRGFLYGETSIQLFYLDANNGSIRHGWWDVKRQRWGFENFDGVAGSLGGSTATVGYQIDGIAWAENGIQMFYYDSTNKALRHAWWDVKRQRWGFENFDGVTGSLGGSTNDVGNAVSVVEYNGGLQIYYFDRTAGELKHAWWDTKKQRWGVEVLDGNAGSVIGNTINAGQQIQAVNYQSGLYVFYYDNARILSDNTRTDGWRLAYWSNGTWQGRMLDGGDGNISGTPERVAGDISADVFSDGRQLQIFYQDASGGLKHSWITR